MKFYSTNNRNLNIDAKDAVTKGLAPDGGLFMPETIAQMPAEFFKDLSELSLQEIAYEVLHPYFGHDFSDSIFKQIIDETFNFIIPVKKVSDNISVLELFHGPTLAFKDIGARFLARILSQYVKDMDRDVYVLVATSGDTGSAVANGFLNVEGVKVIVLYPEGMVSERQEKQFTTLGANITALEIKGTFDDCQKIVKQAFSDKELNNKMFLTSANSINIARLLPQSVYYYHAFAQLTEKQKANVVFAVPSGNFGNLSAGLIAKKSGLPVKYYIAATNVNDIFPEYLLTGKYIPRPSVSTLANAMDVGDPSNFVRITDLYAGDVELLKNVVSASVASDQNIKETIKNVFKAYDYILDPHGACGFNALERNLKDESGVFFATAHPAKFPEVIEEQINEKIDVPHRMMKFLKGEKNTIKMNIDYNKFKEFLKLSDK